MLCGCWTIILRELLEFMRSASLGDTSVMACDKVRIKDYVWAPTRFFIMNVMIYSNSWIVGEKTHESVDTCHAPFSFAVLIFCGLYFGHEANCEIHNYVGVKLANGRPCCSCNYIYITNL